MTIVVTWNGVWSVAKYVLVFGSGFAACFVWMALGIQNVFARRW